MISYTYQTTTYNGLDYFRPTRISSNLGFYITIAYQGDVFPSNEWGQVRVAALYSIADAQAPLQQLTYGTGGGITDIGGRTFICTGCANQLGVKLETASGSLKLPGEGSPSLAVAVSTQPEVVAGQPLVGSVTRDGVTWTYSYGGLDFINAAIGYRYNSVTVTGPNGFNQVYYMTASNQRNVIDRVTDSIGRTIDYSFDASYRPILAVYPELNRVSVEYDPVYGNIVSRTTTPKSGTGAVTETAFYDTEGCIAVMCYRPSYALDELNRRTDFAYANFDANGQPTGQLTEQTDPADANGVRRRTIVDYEPGTLRRRSAVTICGTGAACGTSAEIRIEYIYWGSTFLPLTETRVSGTTRLTMTYAYDNAGRVTMIDGPLAGTDDAIFYRYDMFGRRRWEIGPLGDNGDRLTRRHSFRNSDDRVTRTETGTLPDHLSTTLIPLSRVDYDYDSRRNPVRETVRQTVTTALTVYNVLQRTYDDSGRLECEARRMNRTAFPSLPDSACTLGPQGSGAEDNGPDRITRNVYDAAGQLRTVKRALGTPLQQDYARYEYSDNGLRTSLTDANGNRAEMTYDGFDRLRRWIFPSAATGAANPNDYEEYGYDLVGNRTSLRKRDGSTLTYQYDNLNRMIRKIVPSRSGLSPTHSRDVYYGYNVRNLQTYARFDSTTGEGITNSYDGFGRLLSSTNNMDGVSRRLDYRYNLASNRTRITHPDGQAYTYSYDPAGRLTDLWEGAGTTDPLLHFEHDARGRVDVRSEGPSTGSGQAPSSVDYTYDRIGRLTGIGDAFAGGAGNVTATLTHNPANQIRTRTRSNDQYAWTGGYDVSRSYTVNGLNQYTQAGSTTFSYDANGNLTRSGSTTYVYDVENRLVSASGSQAAELRYDPLGRIVELSGSTTRFFLYDGDALVAEYGSTGALINRYVHGSDASADDPLIWHAGGENRWLHADHVGSIVAVTGGAGAIRNINAYDEWGIPDADNVGRFQYSGQMWIGDLGMYHYKARIYSPTLGRFLQTDPVGYDDQINLYAYVGNDPMNRVDPSGMHGRGTGWSNKDWRAFNRSQLAMAAQLERSSSRINSALADGGGRLEREQSRFERQFGPGTATEANMRAVATHQANTAAALRDNGSNGFVAHAQSSQQMQNSGFQAATFARQGETGRGESTTHMYVNVGHPAFESNEADGRSWGVGHDAGHNVGLQDAFVDNVRAYRYGSPAERAAFRALPGRDSAAAMLNPDSILEYSE